MKFHRRRPFITKAAHTGDGEHGLMIIVAGVAIAIALLIATSLPEALDIASSHANAAQAMLGGSGARSPAERP